ncbi:MAG: hypothetical protein J7K61_04265 [Thermoplasmata archaeon]|nr:hypothetical protein [Thermoplasmata archaeon]
MMRKIKVKKCTIYILPVIHGLREEERKVEKAFEDVKPDCIAIGISPEDIEGLKEDSDGMAQQYEYYLAHLSRYGKIAVPPPDIKRAYELAIENKIELHTIDVDDDEYATLLVKNVSIIALIRHSRKMKKLNKIEIKADNAEEFVMKWDKYMNSIKGFRKIEEAREKAMAENLVKIADKCKKILAIIPLERSNGVITHLERYKNL